MQSTLSKNLSLFILILAFVAFVYGTYRAIEVVNKTQMATSEGTYTSYVSTSKEIEKKAKELTQMCSTKVCKVQSLVNYVTRIPYRTQTFQRKKPLQTMSQNFGDCDDKSNLLISLLHAQNIEAYFVLVPKHIFVIVPLEERKLQQTKGLWIAGRKYYILESTAKNSAIGFPLRYKTEEIDVIIEPFSNKKMELKALIYKP